MNERVGNTIYFNGKPYPSDKPRKEISMVGYVFAVNCIKVCEILLTDDGKALAKHRHNSKLTW